MDPAVQRRRIDLCTYKDMSAQIFNIFLWTQTVQLELDVLVFDELEYQVRTCAVCWTAVRGSLAFSTLCTAS